MNEFSSHLVKQCHSLRQLQTHEVPSIHYQRLSGRADQASSAWSSRCWRLMKAWM